MFEWGKFIGAGGGELDWKINCDDLTDADLECIARAALKRLPLFHAVVPVPGGGIRLAKAILDVCAGEDDDSATYLVVDDVWTTGTSMRRLVEDCGFTEWHGFVIFARGPTPPNVTALCRVWG
jgi:hypothetical protein